MVCPKCHGHMQTYNRNGVQIEQCGNCRGIFLDYGELETLTQLEGRWAQPPRRRRPTRPRRSTSSPPPRSGPLRTTAATVTVMGSTAATTTGTASRTCSSRRDLVTS